MSVCSFSTCSGEQHSKNSFLLLCFFCNAWRSSAYSWLVFVLHLSSSFLIQNAHCLYRLHYSLPQHDTDTAGGRVCGLHRRLIYIVSKRKKRELEITVERPFIKPSESFVALEYCCWGTQCNPSNWLRRSFCSLAACQLENTTLHIQAPLPTASCSPLSHSETKHTQCQTAVQSRG